VGDEEEGNHFGMLRGSGRGILECWRLVGFKVAARIYSGEEKGAGWLYLYHTVFVRIV